MQKITGLTISAIFKTQRERQCSGKGSPRKKTKYEAYSVTNSKWAGLSQTSRRQIENRSGCGRARGYLPYMAKDGKRLFAFSDFFLHNVHKKTFYKIFYGFRFLVKDTRELNGDKSHSLFLKPPFAEGEFFFAAYENEFL